MTKYRELVGVFAGIKSPEEMDRFLHEILTPKELEDVWRRWQILNEISEGFPQREIAERHQMSLCKVTRGSKVLRKPQSICRKIINQRKKQK